MTTLSQWIKVCGVTSAYDATIVADAGADALGLIFATQSKRFVDDANVEGILRAGTSLTCVGVFKDRSEADILSIVDTWALGTVQLHDEPTSVLLDHLRQREVAVIRALAASSLTDTYDETRYRALLVDAAEPGSGERFEWDTFRPRALSVPLIVAGGLTPENVAMCITTLGPDGVDVASGTEARPGVKDHEKVAKFISQARTAWTRRGDA
jgi:phosphoribosylanthranilate isomerase